jgi:hypothetical protein
MGETILEMLNALPPRHKQPVQLRQGKLKGKLLS